MSVNVTARPGTAARFVFRLENPNDFEQGVDLNENGVGDLRVTMADVSAVANNEEGIEFEEMDLLAHPEQLEKFKEEGRDARGFAWVDSLSIDTRLGLRMLLKHKGLTIVGGSAPSSESRRAAAATPRRTPATGCRKSGA